MAVDDRTRLNLHRKLQAVLGPEEADTLMAHLPPVTSHDVATKDDLRVLAAEIRLELRTEISDMRTEISGVRTELRAGLADVRTEIADVRTGLADVRAEIGQAIDRQTRWMVTFIAGWSTLMVAAARLLF